MTIDEQLTYLRKGMAEIIREEDLRERLAAAEKEGRKLRVKAGFDPTAHDQLIVRWHKPLDPVRRRALVAKAHAIGAF